MRTRERTAKLKRDTKRILKTMTYKPGWKVKLKSVDANELIFRTLCVTDDASGTVHIPKGAAMTLDMLTHFYYGGEDMDDAAIEEAIERVIQILNKHEHEEWLKFNGRHFRTPSHGLL